MNNKEKELEELKIDDFIWVINLFIVIFALLSNYHEKKYILNNNKTDKDIYKTINIAILIVILLIYFYYVYKKQDALKNIKNTSSNKDVFIAQINYVASILILIATIIYLYTEIISNDINNEGIDVF